jgi:hypothetical protein
VWVSLAQLNVPSTMGKPAACRGRCDKMPVLEPGAREAVSSPSIATPSFASPTAGGGKLVGPRCGPSVGEHGITDRTRSRARQRLAGQPRLARSESGWGSRTAGPRSASSAQQRQCRGVAVANLIQDDLARIDCCSRLGQFNTGSVLRTSSTTPCSRVWAAACPPIRGCTPTS